MNAPRMLPLVTLKATDGTFWVDCRLRQLRDAATLRFMDFGTIAELRAYLKRNAAKVVNRPDAWPEYLALID